MLSSSSREIKSPSQTCQYMFGWYWCTNDRWSNGPIIMLHEYKTSVRVYWCKKIIHMWPRSRDIKCTCICSKAWSSSLSSAPITTCILALSSIFYLYTTCTPLVALRNTIYFYVLLLTFVCGISRLAMKGSPNRRSRQCTMLIECITEHSNLF